MTISSLCLAICSGPRSAGGRGNEVSLAFEAGKLQADEAPCRDWKLTWKAINQNSQILLRLQTCLLLTPAGWEIQGGMSYTVATLLCSVPQSAPPNLIKNAKKVPFKHACISSSARPAYLCFSQTFTKERRSLSEDASHAAAASEHMVNYEAGKKKERKKKKIQSKHEGKTNVYFL